MVVIVDLPSWLSNKSTYQRNLSSSYLTRQNLPKFPEMIRGWRTIDHGRKEISLVEGKMFVLFPNFTLGGPSTWCIRLYVWIQSVRGKDPHSKYSLILLYPFVPDRLPVGTFFSDLRILNFFLCVCLIVKRIQSIQD